MVKFQPYGWAVEFGNDLCAFFKRDEGEKAMNFAIHHDCGSEVIQHGIRKCLYELVEIPEPQENVCDSPSV